MKKAVYITCLIFSLVFLGENINFMYAQLENGIKEVQTEENLNADLNNSDTQPQQEQYLEEFPGEYTEETENNGEIYGEIYIEESNENKQNMDDLDIEEFDDGISTFLYEDREINVYDVEQVTQEIDTSEYGIIRIADPNNPGKGITIHDRNLGAVTTGYGTNAPDTSYGYYYQWGNNYGFPSTGDIEKVLSYSETNIDASEYLPSTYSSDTFIIENNDWSHISNDNLRGGELDTIENGRGYPVNNVSDRQGPCPTGYHVPSIGELSKLLEFWAYEYKGSSNNILKFEDNLAEFSSQQTNAFINFDKRFFVPLPGYHSHNSSSTILRHKSAILFYSSTPSISNGGAYRMNLRNEGWIRASGKTEARADGFSIRCFLNSYWLPKIVTYHINGGYWSGSVDSEDKSLIYISNDGIDYIPNKELGIIKRDNTCGENGDKKCMFAGWYTLTGDELWTGNLVGDITVYAKWLPFEDKDITLSGINFTVIDRNLGTINPGTGENSYGYYLTGGEEDIMCPEGYHIPDTGEWLGISKILKSGFDGNYINDLLNLPFAGKIVNNEIVGTGEDGYYLAKNGEEIMYARINNSGIETKNIEEGEKVSARCFKDYNTGTIKFNTNGGDNIGSITAVNWREEGDNLESPERENSIFSGWYTTFNFQEGTKIEKNINYKNEEEINVYAKWECGEGYKENVNQCEAIYFNIKWIDGNGNTLKTDSVKRGSMPIYNGLTPIKDSDSDYNYTFNGKWLPEIILATGDAEYIAQFDAEPIKKSGGGSSGGGGKSTKDDAHGSANLLIMSGKNLNNNFNTGNVDIISIDYINTKLSLNKVPGKNMMNLVSDGKYFYDKQSKGGNNEFIYAYDFAKNHGIITANSIEEAKMYSPITRIEMAEMLSNYAINVIGKEPNISKGMIKFNDITNKLNSEYDNAITKAYQLGIMGQNLNNNNFRPHDKVTRAEFATVLSRLLYGTEDGKGNIKYYEPHIAKLYNEGIINNIDPKNKEYRGYVMLMLMRTLQ